MNKIILKDLPELVNAGIITSDVADKIHGYYQHKSNHTQNRLFIVFGILGALLIGLGIILIIAHNWDELSRTVKTGFAFLPLLIGQLLCAYSLLKKNESTAWKESTATFLFFSVGASISLVSQIYHIPGNLSAFLLTWMLLCLPLVYLLRSSVVSLLAIVGITYYACETGYWTYPASMPYGYWLLLLSVFPHYYLLYKHKSRSNFITFHHWLIPLSVIIALGTLAKTNEELMFIAYLSLFGLLYLIGSIGFFKHKKLINNGYLILGSLGTIITLLPLSFDWFWKDLHEHNFMFPAIIMSPEFLVSAFTSLAAALLLYWKVKRDSWKEVDPTALIFMLFIIIFMAGVFSVMLSVIMVNLVIFLLGILTIRNGARKHHLGMLNYGLLIITVLIICRFFDIQISFVMRGLLFVVVGAGFFVVNYYMFKRRDSREVSV